MKVLLLVLCLSLIFHATSEDEVASNGNGRPVHMIGPTSAPHRPVNLPIPIARLRRGEVAEQKEKMEGLVPHPPCQSDDCAESRACCASRWGGGSKYSWPELVGKTGEEAKAVIESQYKIGTVYIEPPGMYVDNFFCCNRIFVFVDKHDVVIRPPVVG